MFRVTEGHGAVSFYGLCSLKGSFLSGAGSFRVTSLGGFSLYSGNFPIVPNTPDLFGLLGRKLESCAAMLSLH